MSYFLRNVSGSIDYSLYVPSSRSINSVRLFISWISEIVKSWPALKVICAVQRNDESFIAVKGMLHTNLRTMLSKIIVSINKKIQLVGYGPVFHTYVERMSIKWGSRAHVFGQNSQHQITTAVPADRPRPATSTDPLWFLGSLSKGSFFGGTDHDDLKDVPTLERFVAGEDKGTVGEDHVVSGFGDPAYESSMAWLKLAILVETLKAGPFLFFGDRNAVT